MRIALLSDVHANLPALQAVLEDVDRWEPDAIYHLGDLVGYAPWPDETVELLQERRIAGVAGNYDSTVATHHEHCGCRYEDPRQAALAHESFAWTVREVSEATRRVLLGLPFRIDVRPSGGHGPGPRLVLVHGVPALNTVYWTEDRNDAFRRKMVDAAGARAGDVLAFGHTHVPWTGESQGVRLVNTGSVGRPRDGDPRACWVRLRMEGATAEVEHVRVPYDVQRVARAVRESDLPDFFADYLETGGGPIF
ncbi:MAG: metallophosphoesterase family protein [Gemmatimonadota bacterium]|jgi:predicted phosphodiesterase